MNNCIYVGTTIRKFWLLTPLCSQVINHLGAVSLGKENNLRFPLPLTFKVAKLVRQILIYFIKINLKCAAAPKFFLTYYQLEFAFTFNVLLPAIFLLRSFCILYYQRNLFYLIETSEILTPKLVKLCMKVCLFFGDIGTWLLPFFFYVYMVVPLYSRFLTLGEEIYFGISACHLHLMLISDRKS